jgi:ribosomal protein S18 acetylase RimI-like enzyme
MYTSRTPVQRVLVQPALFEHLLCRPVSALDANERLAESQLDSRDTIPRWYVGSMIVIRRATLFEVPELMALVRKVVPLMRAAGNLQWDDSYPTSDVFLEDIRQRQLWVADVEGILAGVAAITTDQAPEYAEVGWDISETAIVVHRLAVDPDFRGFGIATMLMEEAEALAYEQGIGVLRVDTSKQNEATQRLFPKLGYMYAGEVGLAFRPGLRVLCYEKRLVEQP